MNREEFKIMNNEIRAYLEQIDQLLIKVLETGKGIPFVEKNVRATRGLLYAFKNGLIEPDID